MKRIILFCFTMLTCLSIYASTDCELRNPILFAIGHDEIPRLKSYIGQKVDLDISASYCPPPLHYAIEKKKPEIVRLLIEGGAKIDHIVFQRQRAIEYAISRNDIDMVTLLLDLGADINFTVGDTTPLIYSIMFKSPEATQLFIDRGADLNLEDSEGTSSLRSTFYTRNYELFFSLIDKGAVLSEKDRRINYYSIAIASGDIYLVRKLMEIMGSPAELTAALDSAIMYGDKLIFRYLIREGAELSISTVKYALSCNRYDMAEYVLDRGVDINALINGESLILFEYVYKDDLIEFRWLVEHGADVNALAPESSWRGRTVLEFAIHLGKIEMIKFLLENGAVIDSEIYGDKPLMLTAIEEQDSEMVRLLLMYGAKTEYNSDEITDPIYEVLIAKDRRSLEYLIQYRADLNKMASDGEATPLRCAILVGDSSAVKMLLDAGVKATSFKLLGTSDVAFAKEHRQYLIASIIKDHIKENK